jgi:hypothetical protein
LITGLALFIPFNTLFGQSNSSGNSPVKSVAAVSLPTLPSNVSSVAYTDGILRSNDPHTTLPDRPRWDISYYTVQDGDTVFGIGDKFGLQPSTILWSNLEILGDDPHNLAPGMKIVILPVDGAYHKWSAGEGLNGIAAYYHVTPDDIINWPGNHLTKESVGDYADPNIKPGTMLIIPGGQREFISWSAPIIRRSDPSSAKLYGPGACGEIAYGAIGTGTFVWPSTEHYISGFDYHPAANHPAIDIGAHLGNPIFAADTGVVVYAGWNNFGYGNVIVIDHGNGYQTLYAHQASIIVGCGESVYKGETIGYVGMTGNTSGPHLHFEMWYGDSHVNPHDYVQ